MGPAERASGPAGVIPLPPGGEAMWDRVFVVAPLVLVGTLEPDGAHDLAPKHQVVPLGWTDFVGVACTPTHRTHANTVRTGAFTVSYPTPEQVVAIGQAAAPRVGDDKPALAVIPTRPASTVDGVLVEGASLWLECELERVVDGFGTHDLLVGRIVAAAAPEWAVREPDRDDAELLARHPALAFLSPTRFGPVERTYSFPFPADFRR